MCSGIAEAIEICNVSGISSVLHSCRVVFNARSVHKPMAESSEAAEIVKCVLMSFSATPILPKCLPKAPLKSMKPMCKRAEAIMVTFS